MRQPGANDFKIDPYLAQVTAPMPAPVLPVSFQKEHERWSTNLSIARQFKFCSTLCVNFKGGVELSSSEESCVNTCFSKYAHALSFFNQEKDLFYDNLKDLALRGEDKYVVRDI